MAFLRLIRVVNLIILALSLYLFYYFIIQVNHTNILQTHLVLFTPFDFALFVLSVVLVAAAGNIINDYCDFELDRRYKPERPLPSGAFTMDQAMYLHAVFAFAGIGLGFYLAYSYSNIKVGYFYVLAVILLYLYSAYIKKIPLAGNVLVSALAGFVFVLLLLFEINFLNLIHFDFAPRMLHVLQSSVLFYGGFAFLTNLARELVKDLEDIEGDASLNYHTLPVAFGENAGRIAATLVISILIFALAYYMNGFYVSYARKEFYYLLLAVQLPLLVAVYLLFKSSAQKDYARISLLLKLIMLSGILSIPAFYYFNQ